jgi:hypothetical protein
MTIKVTTSKVVNLLLCLSVEVLELVHSGELDDVQTVGKNTIWLSLEQVLTLVGGDVRNGGEDIGGVCCGAFDTVTVVDTSLSGFGIDIEKLEVVVKVDGSCAKVSSEQGSMGCEDRGDVNAALAAEG